MTEDLLLETVTFPLKSDKYGGYLWDSEGEIVAMAMSSKTALLLVKGINAYAEAGLPDVDSILYKCENGVIHCDGKPALMVRGWGRIQYLSSPEARMEVVTDFFLRALSWWDLRIAAPTTPETFPPECVAVGTSANRAYSLRR